MLTCLKRCSRSRRPSLRFFGKSQYDSLIIGCSGLCNRSLREVQCGEGHCILHQEGDGQEVGNKDFRSFSEDLTWFLRVISLFRYNPTWHCIVGRNFGSYVTHETRWTWTRFWNHCNYKNVNRILLKPNQQAFHLLLPRSSGRPPFQEWLSCQIKIGPDFSDILWYYLREKCSEDLNLPLISICSWKMGS